MIGGVGAQLNDFCAVRDDKPIHVVGVDERSVAPRAGVARESLQPFPASHECFRRADEADIDAVARCSRPADAQVPALVARHHVQRELRALKSKIGVRVFMRLHFRGGEAQRRRKFFELRKQCFHGGGLRGISDWFGQLPDAVRANETQFTFTIGDDFNGRDLRGVKVGEQQVGFRCGRGEVFFGKPHGCRKRSGEHQPDGCGVGFHLRRTSQTSHPKNRTPPGNAPSSSQRRRFWSWLESESRNSCTGRGLMPESNCSRLASQLTE